MYSGICIKRLRVFKEIKQETVAKRLGISQQAYSKLENCEQISNERLVEILAAMGCTVTDLESIINLYHTPQNSGNIKLNS